MSKLHKEGDRWVESIQDTKYPDIFTYEVCEMYQGQVCRIAEIDNDLEEANLIATAPELLDELKKADSIIMELYKQIHGLPKEAFDKIKWPYLRQMERPHIIAKTEQ